MTETESETALHQAGVDASQALLGLGGSIDEEATTPELMTERESPADEDPIDQHTTRSAELRPDTNPHPHPHDSNNTTAVTDEDQPAAAAAAANRPRSGKMRRKVANRTYGSPVFASKPPAAAVVSTTTASTKIDFYPYDESSSVPSLQLFRESAFRPLTETAAIIESEMGVASLEDLDMAAPMLLYSLSTSSARSHHRKRKQRELQQEQEQEEEQQAAAEEMLLFTPVPVTSVPAPAAKKLVPSPVKKRKLPVSAEKVKRTRSKPAISRKKQESISYVATSKKSSTKTSQKKKTRAAQYAKTGEVPVKVKRTYVKKSLELARECGINVSPSGPVKMPVIRRDVVLPWPMKGEIFPSLRPNDVLSGRGNGVAIYPGNRQFREFIRNFKDTYVRAFRNEKGTVASDVIRTVLSLNPPGRFVEKAKKGDGYQLVDYSRALEKTSQALREGSAALRSMVYKDMNNEKGPHGNTPGAHGNTRGATFKVKERVVGKAKERVKVKERVSEMVEKAKEKAKDGSKVKVEEKEEGRRQAD